MTLGTVARLACDERDQKAQRGEEAGFRRMTLGTVARLACDEREETA